MANTFEYEVVIYGETQPVSSYKEAEDKIKRIEHSDFSVSYIVKKEFSPSGKLVEIYAVF